MCRQQPNNGFESRVGFTLIELLVVLTLLLVLAGLALAILPRLSDGQNTNRAATQLQQWFEIAKQKAARDRKPFGVRLVADSSNPGLVNTLEFLEQPDSYNLGQSATGVASIAIISGTTVTFQNTSKTLTGGFAVPALYPVQGGDYIELGGVLYRISGVTDATNLTLNSAGPPLLATSSYKITRQPRPLGDDPLEMAKTVVIDLTPRGIGGGVWDLPVPTANTPLDIMFAPDGRVIGPMAGRDKIIFWVRDKTLPGKVGDTSAEGDPTLIVIYPKTGLVAAYPVDTTNFGQAGWNPYSYTGTGKRSSD